MTNDELDPAGPILAALFETASSDSIITVVDRAGLPIDWTLNQSQAYSNKTRKREYRLRVGEALNAIRPPDRTGALSRIALGASEAPSVDIESLNRALAPTGWLFVDGELCPLIQGPTASDAPAITPGVRAIAVIVTALDLEACAIRDHLSEIVEEPHEKGTVYFTGRFDDGGRRWKVAVVIAGPGNPTAAVEVERAAAHYSPSVLLLVGVAGSAERPRPRRRRRRRQGVRLRAWQSGTPVSTTSNVWSVNVPCNPARAGGGVQEPVAETDQGRTAVRISEGRRSAHRRGREGCSRVRLARIPKLKESIQ